MKQRVTIDGNEYEDSDGGLERTRSNLQDGNDVVVENFNYKRHDSFEKLAAEFGTKIHYSDDFLICSIVRP